MEILPLRDMAIVAFLSRFSRYEAFMYRNTLVKSDEEKTLPLDLQERIERVKNRSRGVLRALVIQANLKPLIHTFLDISIVTRGTVRLALENGRGPLADTMICWAAQKYDKRVWKKSAVKRKKKLWKLVRAAYEVRDVTRAEEYMRVLGLSLGDTWYLPSRFLGIVRSGDVALLRSLALLGRFLYMPVNSIEFHRKALEKAASSGNVAMLEEVQKLVSPHAHSLALLAKSIKNGHMAMFLHLHATLSLLPMSTYPSLATRSEGPVELIDYLLELFERYEKPEGQRDSFQDWDNTSIYILKDCNITENVRESIRQAREHFLRDAFENGRYDLVQRWWKDEYVTSDLALFLLRHHEYQYLIRALCHLRARTGSRARRTSSEISFSSTTQREEWIARNIGPYVNCDWYDILKSTRSSPFMDALVLNLDIPTLRSITGGWLMGQERDRIFRRIWALPITPQIFFSERTDGPWLLNIFNIWVQSNPDLEDIMKEVP